VNRTLPPGDCGSQSAASGRPSGYRGFVPGFTRLVLGIAATLECTATAAAFTVNKRGGFARFRAKHHAPPEKDAEPYVSD